MEEDVTDLESEENKEIVERCLICGREFRDGEGRFRRCDGTVCIECHSQSVAKSGCRMSRDGKFG